VVFVGVYCLSPRIVVHFGIGLGIGIKFRLMERSAINTAINRPRNLHTLYSQIHHQLLMLQQLVAAYRADKKKQTTTTMITTTFSFHGNVSLVQVNRLH